MAVRSSSALWAVDSPRALPPSVGLMTTGKLTPCSMALRTLVAPTWRKRAWGSENHPGVGIPAEARSAFAVGLFEASMDWTLADPTKGMPRDSSSVCREPSSPMEPWTRGHTTLGWNEAIVDTSVSLTSVMRTTNPARVRIFATRRPERTETSRSWVSPPAMMRTLVGVAMGCS